MPSTVYKGDISEATFGHETGFTLEYDYHNGLRFSVQTTADDVTTLRMTAGGGAGHFVAPTTYFLRYPAGLLAGSKLRVKGGGALSADDHASTGNIYTIVDNSGTDILVTPAMKTAAVTAATAGDALIIDSLGTPTIDVGMAHTANADSSDETVLTDQFIGLAATLTFPETKAEIRRSHIIGIGRDVVVQEPQRFSNEGGTIEMMLNSPRWLYYGLGNEAVYNGNSVKNTLGGPTLKAVSMGDTYLEFNTGTVTGTPAVGDYILLSDITDVLTPTDHEDPINTGVKWTQLQTNFQTTTRSEIRRVICIDTGPSATECRIHVDDPFNFNHVTMASANVFVIALLDDSTTGSPDFVTTTANYGTITNRQSRALFSGYHTPSFSLETSMRTRNVDSYGTTGAVGTQSSNVPDSASDSKQLTRIYKGCKVKEWSITADADAEVKMSVSFDALMCYTDTGRLEAAANNGDRYTAHRMFENVGNGRKERKMAGIAPDTEKPYFFYNGTISAFGFNLAQVTNFSLSGRNNTATHYTIRGNPLAESRNAAGKSLEQIPFGGSRNPSLIVEGKVEYEMSMTIIVSDPLLWHEFRSSRTHNHTEPITLTLTKAGAGATNTREQLVIIIDDYIIQEAPLGIPEDKGVIKSELKILPKHVKIVSHDALMHS